MNFGKWNFAIPIPLVHWQVFHKLALRSEEYHHLFCTYAVQTWLKITRCNIFFCKKVVGIENNSYLCTVTIK